MLSAKPTEGFSKNLKKNIHKKDKNKNNLSCRSDINRLLFHITFGVVGLIENVINADAVKFGKPYQHGGGQIVLAGFVFRVTRLRHSENTGNLGLIKVSVLTEITNSSVHFSHLREIIH